MNESRFPLYVVSHDRATTSQTIKELDRWGTEFNIVIESSDYEAYADEWS